MRPADWLRSVLFAVGVGLVTGPAFAQSVEDDQAAPPEEHAPMPGGRGGAGSQMFEPPPDTNDEDPRLPGGSIAIVLLDGDNAPLPGVAVTLGILHNSVAKGESREHKLGTTDASGLLTFSGLERSSGIAYRVSVVKDGGTFWATPFGLAPDRGMRVRLHVYPVTHDLRKALVVAKVALYAEMKDDRVQLEQAVTFFNLGRVAWVPDDLVIRLPEGFTALNGQQAMGGEGIDPIENRGAKIRGTFGPGQHPIEFRWQLPYAGEKDVVFDEGLPPNVAMTQVMAAASQQMRLVVTGFPEAQPRTDAQGERLLITEKQMRKEDAPLSQLHVELRDLPTPGPARWIATALAGFGVLAGIGYAFSTRKGARGSAGGREHRASLLVDLEELERAHRAGDVGPKTYERARRELIDAIARTLTRSAVTTAAE
jgi:hypothetical protein